MTRGSTRSDYYDVDGNPITAERWAIFMNDMPYRRVALDSLPSTSVSTVWLGLDHSFGGASEPLIFETLAYDKNGDEVMFRYATREQALEGHRKVVAMLDPWDRYVNDGLWTELPKGDPPDTS